MDKYNENPNNPGLSADCPNPSSTDSMIEQFKIDITTKLHDSLRNARVLTIEPDKPTPESDIDKQISELEGMIKKLQGEIEEMSQNADRDANKDYTIVSEKSSNIISGLVEHVYPMILKDVAMKHEQHQLKDERAHDTDITKNFRVLWNDDTLDNQKETEDIDDSIDQLIEELQTELIAEKMNKPKEAEQDKEESPENIKHEE